MDEIFHIITDRIFSQHVTKSVLVAADGGEWAAPLWSALADAGLPIALVPEKNGGPGLLPNDVARLIRQSGYHSVPLPLAETIVANALWVTAGGEILPGPATIGPVHQRDRITIERTKHGDVVRGTVHGIPWGTRADTLIVYARHERNGPVLCQLRREQIHSAWTRRNVAYEPRDDISLDDVAVSNEQVRVASPELHRDALMIYGAAMRSHQMIGAMQRCLDYALTYAGERVQFGRTIGSFQVVQSMLAIAAGHMAAAVAAGDAILSAEGFADDPFAVAIAKARIGEAAGQIAAVSHQVFGAMGFTHEHPLHFATRRLWAWRDEFGSESYWQERIGRTMCAKGGEGFWPFLSAPPSVLSGERLAELPSPPSSPRTAKLFTASIAVPHLAD